MVIGCVIGFGSPTGVAKDPGPGSLRLGWWGARSKKYQLYVGIGSVGIIRT
jgi:hypothetical protein